MKRRHAGMVAIAAATVLGSSTAVATPAPTSADLSVMTYNIHGLPWPLGGNRDSDFDAIAERLRAMRKAGTEPHVVVLQEAFTPEAKAIGARSGYAYIVNGPATNDRSLATATREDRRFAARASWLKGERSGKLVDSGLQILSDYPILAVRRMPFPAYACAGYDCLANKGVLMAVIAVPGSATPVVVATAHFNSRHSSGVADDRSNYAHRRQVDAAGAFLAHSPWHDYPMIFSGDFNIGKSAPRQSYFAAAFAGWWSKSRRGPVLDAMHACHGLSGRFPVAAEESFKRAKDWQLFASTRSASIRVDSISVPFGRDGTGAMLSDHFGYTARFLLTPQIARDWRFASAANAYARLK